MVSFSLYFNRDIHYWIILYCNWNFLWFKDWCTHIYFYGCYFAIFHLKF